MESTPRAEYVNPPLEQFFRFNPNMEPLQRTMARNARSICERQGLSEPALVKAGVPAGSAHRAMTADGQNVTLAVLAKFAKALKVPAWLLLHPQLDAARTLVITSEAELEAEVERRFRERLKPLGAMIGGLVDPEESRPDGRSAALPYPVGPAAKGKPTGAARVQTAHEPEVKGRRRS